MIFYFFPAQILEGQESPDRRFQAKLYQNAKNSHLMVYERNTSRIWIANQNYVQEFYWLNKNSLVSTNKFDRYHSGIFVWNLDSDYVFNLTDKLKKKIKLKNFEDLCLTLVRSEKEIVANALACSKIESFENFYAQENQFKIIKNKYSYDFENIETIDTEDL